MITEAQLLAKLSQHIGKENGLHAKELVMAITHEVASLPSEERHVRQLISDLRRQGYHICGQPSSGYFMAANDEELDHTCNFLYERAKTSLEQIARMKKTSMPDLRGQLRLPS